LNAIIDTSAFLFDANLINLLLKWQHSNDKLISMLYRVDLADLQSRKDICLVLRANIHFTIEVKEWLEKTLVKYSKKVE
jgi:hypothetical protein